MYHLVKNHAFNDANKRTGCSSMLIFLEMNEYVLEISDDLLEDLVVNIANGQITKEDLIDGNQKHLLALSRKNT